MPIVTIKERISFPEIGQIRKGQPKTKEGYVGSDLGERFRVVFFPGVDNERSRQIFHQNHGGNIVDSIQFMFPFTDPFQCWDYWYEAYSRGRMIARADGEKFIRWVDTETGDVKVENGEPYTQFKRGMVVGHYVNKKGNRVPVKCRVSGRLRVLLPELDRLAFLTVITTSIYDVQRISEQLWAFQTLTSIFGTPRGVSGIPMTLIRRLTEITWAQDDGSAVRVKHGLLNIETDQDYVHAMVSGLKSRAYMLPSGTTAQVERALSPIGDQFEMDIAPEDREQAIINAEHTPDEPEIEDGFYTDDPSGGIPEPPAQPGSDSATDDPQLLSEKEATQEFFKIAYQVLKWNRDQAMQVVSDCDKNFFVALEKIKKQIPPASI